MRHVAKLAVFGTIIVGLGLSQEYSPANEFRISLSSF